MLQTLPEPTLISIERPRPAPGLDDPVAPARPQWNSEQLLAHGDEALIEHHGETYRLRRTMTGKLILTK